MVNLTKALNSERKCYIRITLLIIMGLVLLILLDNVSFAEQQIIVFYLDENYSPMVNLKQLKPPSDGIKAILAMYALQVGGGCQGHDESGLRCKLTTAIGLGAQCSPQHLNLVSSWFKKSIPIMSGYPKHTIDNALKSKNLLSICYNAPEGATIQEIWEIIRIKQKNDLVFVNAISSWTVSADGPSGKKQYKSVYRIGPHDVTVVSHEEKKIKRDNNH